LAPPACRIARRRAPDALRRGGRRERRRFGLRNEFIDQRNDDRPLFAVIMIALTVPVTEPRKAKRTPVAAVIELASKTHSLAAIIHALNVMKSTLCDINGRGKGSS
jgi:hypothetical protein